MPLQIQFEPTDVCVLRVSGLLKQSEFGAAQQEMAKKMDAGSKPRVLAVLENFEGWERGTDWNDIDFMIAHGNDISRIAVVGDPRWETQAMAFAGAGVRGVPVRFFGSGELKNARSWLVED